MKKKLSVADQNYVKTNYKKLTLSELSNDTGVSTDVIEEFVNAKCRSQNKPSAQPDNSREGVTSLTSAASEAADKAEGVVDIKSYNKRRGCVHDCRVATPK